MMLLASCGFQALHGKKFRHSLTVDLSAVSVVVAGSGLLSTNTMVLPARYSELLKAEIEDQVNPTSIVSEKLYRLDITYTENNMSLFVKPDGTASRGDLVCDSSYRITRIRDNRMVAKGALQRTSSYNSSQNADYASYVSIEDARKRGIRELAEDYKLRLASLLPILNDPDAATLVPSEAPEETFPALQPMHNHEINGTGY
ncbi:MAG: hypothetical protein ACOYNL_07570 [Rickettsiales bacterium]